MFGSRKRLGLAATRQAITLVELVASRGRCRVLSAVELPEVAAEATMGVLVVIFRRSPCNSKRQ